MLDESFSVELAKQPVPEPHIAIDVKDDELAPSSDPPPPFAPYEPEFFYNSDGDIVSHDRHLNQDGEALYRFLLAQSSILPAYTLHILGTHKERRTRIITTRNKDGSTSQRIEHHTVTITDFSFYIDCSPYIVHGPIFWSYPDNAAVYRGLMVRQVDSEKSGRRKATEDEIGKFKSEKYLREDGGLPPWHYGSDSSGGDSVKPDTSSKTPREWADEYAASPKLLKEFLYEKTIHGWNPTALSSSIATSIASTSYTGRVDATFTLSRNKIHIRPDNRLSRTLSSTLYKVLLIITLVYPFIWLFKRCGKRGGGRWEIVGAAYALKRVEVLDADKNLIEASVSKSMSGSEVLEAVKSDTTYPSSNGSGIKQEGESSQGNDTTFRSANPVHNTRIVQGEQGEKLRVMGYREGEWFREWEPVIKRCAAMRLSRTSDEPLREIGDAPRDPREALEGYTAGSGLDGY